VRSQLAFLVAAALASGCSKSSAQSSSEADAGGDSGDAGWPEVPRAPSKLALADLTGLSSHPMLGSDAVSTAERAFEWSKLAELGLHRMRTDFTWATIEPQRGTFDFSGYDTLVTEAQAHGVDMLAVLDYGVPWATADAGSSDGYPPDNPGDFGAFAAAVASRYQASLTDYEVWNEPNNGLRFWLPTLDGDPVAYGALLLETYQDLLAAEPSAHVAYAGTVYDDLVPGPDFVGQSLADTPGLASALGVLGMHAYMIYPPVRGPESTVGGETPELDKIATMSGVLATEGASSIPIWITEIGWPTMSDDPADQVARYTVRAVVLGALGGADRVFLYTLLDGPDPDAYPPEDAFGLVTYSDFAADAGTPTELPAFIAVKALMGAVGSYAVTQRLAAQPEDVYLVELSNGTQSAWVAWRSLDGVPATSVTVPADGNVLVTQVDGSTVDDVASGGAYVIQVGPDPVIVTSR
jgi:hypothetical protein